MKRFIPPLTTWVPGNSHLDMWSPHNRKNICFPQTFLFFSFFISSQGCINRACFQNKGAGVSDSTSVCNFSREGACPSEDHLCRKADGSGSIFWDAANTCCRCHFMEWEGCVHACALLNHKPSCFWFTCKHWVKHSVCCAPLNGQTHLQMDPCKWSNKCLCCEARLTRTRFPCL